MTVETHVCACRMRPWVLLPVLLCAAGHVCTYMRCTVCVPVPAGNLYPASLLAGPGPWSHTSLASVTLPNLGTFNQKIENVFQLLILLSS